MVIIRFVGVGLLALVAVACGAGTGQYSAAPTGSGDRVAALHAAAECLRRHGINNFADPVLDANGQVFTDQRALENAEPRGAAEAAANACRGELNAANWNPEQLPPAPAALVAAGGKSARGLRGHGGAKFQMPWARSVRRVRSGFVWTCQ